MRLLIWQLSYSMLDSIARHCWYLLSQLFSRALSSSFCPARRRAGLEGEASAPPMHCAQFKTADYRAQQRRARGDA